MAERNGSPAMAETKLTPEQMAIKHSSMSIPLPFRSGLGSSYQPCLTISECVAAINEYAAQQQGEHERVLAVLREHEWIPFYRDRPEEGSICHECCQVKEYGHTSDCWLAALLAADKEKGNEKG